MGKMPAFQFYPGDWRKDMGVQSLSFHDRGVWWEMLCLMHESERRGVLILNGAAMSEDSLSRLLGLDKQILTTTLTTLLTSGVASREDETGAIYSRRMVRDEQIRKIRTYAGHMGGNPVLLNQKSTTGDKQIPTPSSSSSSSSSKHKNKANGISFTLPDWIDKEAWDAWMEVRRKKRAANTTHALNLAVRELEKLRQQGHDPRDVLNQSILKSYTGLFRVAQNGTNGRQYGKGHSNLAALREALGPDFDGLDTDGDVAGSAGGLTDTQTLFKETGE